MNDLWHGILALPLTAKAIALVVLALAALKARAIKAACKAGVDWLWRELRKRIAPDPRARTYKGEFQGYFQYANYPHEWFFTLKDNGVTHKVPTMKSNLFSGIQHGSYVEVDTQVLPGAKVEVVRRVRVHTK